MAHVSTHITAATPFRQLLAACRLTGDAQSRGRQLDALMALSDAELADRGLRRSEIARYLYSDANWI